MSEELSAEQLAVLPEWAKSIARLPYAGTFWATVAKKRLDTECVVTPEHTEPVCAIFPYAPAPLSAAMIAEVLNRAPELCRLLAEAILREGGK